MRDYIINPRRVNTRVNFIFGRLVVKLRLLRLSKAHAVRVFGATVLGQCKSVIEHTLGRHRNKVCSGLEFEYDLRTCDNVELQSLEEIRRKYFFFNSCETMLLKYSIFCHHLTLTSVSNYIKTLDPNI